MILGRAKPRILQLLSATERLPTRLMLFDFAAAARKVLGDDTRFITLWRDTIIGLALSD
jgi:hypothetical protein